MKKIKRVSIGDNYPNRIMSIAKALPDCDEARKLFVEYLKQGRFTAKDWLKDNPKAAKWAQKQGWVNIEYEEEKWDLELRSNPLNECVSLYDKSSGKHLFGFCKDGSVSHYSSAEGGKGEFDHNGRIVLTKA